jgi:hypothetical protein
VPNELPGPALSRRACLGGLVAVAVALLPRRGRAAPLGGPPTGPGLDRAAHAALADPSGWTLHAAADARGVSVWKKTLPALGAVAWQGEKILDPGADPGRMMDRIADVAGHARMSDELAASVLISRGPGVAEYYQVIKAPALLPVSPRFWINAATDERALGGRPDHHRRAWSSLPLGSRPSVEAEILARFPGAVPLGFTHGSWETWPTEAGTRVRYRMVSDPGGSLPDGLASALAGRALPATILRFERAALGAG